MQTLRLLASCTVILATLAGQQGRDLQAAEKKY